MPLLAASTAQAQTAKYDPGADDKTIKIGTTAPLSGPVSAFAQIAKSAEAYFRKVNDDGGVNGRRIQMIIADDAYSPPKTVEQTRRLVESEEVLLIFGGVGTPTNSAVHKYLNDRKVPQLFLGSGAAKWDDPKNFPWTVGWQPTYRDEAIAYAKYIKASHANAKIGVLYQNDDLGKDYLKALEEGLGSGEAIVARAAYETSAPTVDTQILQLKTAAPTWCWWRQRQNLRRRRSARSARSAGSRRRSSPMSRPRSAACWSRPARTIPPASSPAST